MIFHVQSGSDDYQLRRFHRVQAAVKFIKTQARVDMFGYLEPVRQHAVPPFSIFWLTIPVLVHARRLDQILSGVVHRGNTSN